MIEFIIAHNLVEANGKTRKENNLEIEHKIPVGSLVELENGVRLFVAKQSRDCDGTPLYILNCVDEQAVYSYWDDDQEYQEREVQRAKKRRMGGYGEESIFLVIREDKK